MNRPILCKDLNLDWMQEFVSLGITNNIDKFDDITDLNINFKRKRNSETHSNMECKVLDTIWKNHYS